MQPAIFRLNFDIELHHWWFAARRRILRELVAEVLPPSRETILVDVGCGTGGNVGGLAESYACVGIDPSHDAVALARSRFPHVRFVCGQAPGDLGPVVRKARLFLMTDVLEHVLDDRAMLARWVAAASPGAYFLVTVPADKALWGRHDENHGHYRRYDQAELHRVWADLPVAPRLVSYFNARLQPLVKLVRTASRWLGTGCGRAGTDLAVPSPLVNRLLEWTFAGEGKVLRDLLQGKRRRGYCRGVSLIALVCKTPVIPLVDWPEGPPAARQPPAAVRSAAPSAA